MRTIKINLRVSYIVKKCIVPHAYNKEIKQNLLVLHGSRKCHVMIMKGGYARQIITCSNQCILCDYEKNNEIGNS